MQKKIDNDEIQAFHEASKFRRKYKEFDEQQKIKLKEFKQIWQMGEKIKPKSPSYAIFPWLIALILILFIPNVYNKIQPAQNVPESIFPIVTHNILPIPPTSVLSTFYNADSATCPFSITADQKNYYIKLCDTKKNAQTVAIFFIRAGETLKTTVPSGNYKIKYGSGGDWYGEKELFGEFSQYGESEILNFFSDGYSSQGNTVSLYQRVDGNLHTNRIGRDAVLRN